MTMDDLADRDPAAARATKAPASSTAPNRTFLLQPQGQLETAEQYNNLIIGTRQRCADLSEGRRRRARHACRTSASDMRFWVARSRSAQRRRWSSPSSARPARTPSRSPRRAAICFPRSSRQLPRVGHDHADLRPLAAIVHSVQRRAGDAVHRVRPGRDRDLRVPRPRDRHADSRRRAAAVAAADVHRDARAGLQPGQPFADGADAGDRVPGRRRDRVPGEHRPPDGAVRRDAAHAPPSTAPRRSASRSCR